MFYFHHRLWWQCSTNCNYATASRTAVQLSCSSKPLWRRFEQRILLNGSDRRKFVQTKLESKATIHPKSWRSVQKVHKIGQSHEITNASYQTGQRQFSKCPGVIECLCHFFLYIWISSNQFIRNWFRFFDHLKKKNKRNLIQDLKYMRSEIIVRCYTSTTYQETTRNQNE